MGSLLLASDRAGGVVTGSRNQRLGLVNIDVRCYAPDLPTAIMGDSSVISGPLGIGSLPEWEPRKWSRRPEGEGYDVDLNFSGFIGQDLSGEEFELDGITADDPIESNPNFNTLISVYNGDPDYNGTGRANWPASIKGAHNPMHGVEVYHNPGLTWTHRYVRSVIPSGIIARLGYIDTPAASRTQIPPSDGGRNWIKIRVIAHWIGNCWKIEETWLQSTPYGWVPEIYTFGAAATGSDSKWGQIDLPTDFSTSSFGDSGGGADGSGSSGLPPAMVFDPIAGARALADLPPSTNEGSAFWGAVDYSRVTTTPFGTVSVIEPGGH